MTFPFLSLSIFIPLLAGLIILLLPARFKSWVRGIALGAAAITLLLSIIIYARYDTAAGGYQFIEHLPWVPALGISYYVGVDGISAPLVLLAGIVVFCGVLVSWKVEERINEFFAFLLFLGTSVLGVFASLDLFQLFFFFELAVFPKYLMIIIWGSPKTREYGGMKLTLYLFLGSVIALVGALAIYFGSGLQTFDMLALEKAGFATEFQRLWFPFVFLGFGILGGIFPFHSWAPDGHVAAPTAISMLLAGVEMKVGVFSALRVGIMLLPDGAQMWAPLILILGTINVVYGAFIALIQTDFKYVIGFSSVSHMGLVLIGMATLSPQGLLGAGMQMFSHGVMTALFFAVVGMVYDRAHTREISQLGGLFKKMPWVAMGFIVGGLVSMGMPGFSGFVAEYPIFMGAWRTAPLVAVVAVLGILITAAYILLVVRRVFFGSLPEALAAVSDISWRDKLVIGLLSLTMIALGWFPGLMTPLLVQGVNYILALVGGA
ncbi:MAG TPA: NADH-quinone oxidoreductase subunit M [Anaerolineaceae bacterium]|nr:NADH-quinone oxidoreductase subunit M [Anaerolineaceae bacterium]HQH84907.1 NADH-quinone oxidoreductase subunit M [Anaerolineaceae bacterium]